MAPTTTALATLEPLPRRDALARARDPIDQLSAKLPRSPPGLDPMPVLLTVPEVAVVLRTTRKAIYAMAERGQLPGVTHIGRRLFVRWDDLVFWLDERRAASPGRSQR